MTVTNSNNRTRLSISGYDYDFTFRIDAETELLVYTIDSEGAATLLTLNTDFLVTLDSINEAGSIQTGSYVDAVWTPAAPTGDEILMIRNKPYTQSADIPVRGGFREDVIEQALDDLEMQIQQLKESVDYVLNPDPTAALDAQMAAETAARNAETAQTAAEVAQEAAETAQALAEGAATTAVNAAISSYFNTTTGHDHDGSDSKQVDYNDILNSPLSLDSASDGDIYYVLGGVLTRLPIGTAGQTLKVGSIGDLLIKFNGADGATTYTAETGQTVTFVGTAALDTAIKKFGSASLLLDGNSDYVTLPDNAAYNFGTGPWTIDAWAYFKDDTIFEISQYNSSSSYWTVYAQRSGGKVTCYIAFSSGSATEIKSTATPLATDTWHHFRFVRVNTDNAATAWRIFINGVASKLTLNSGSWQNTLPDSSGSLYIGSNQYSPGYFNGLIDEVRIIKGTALSTSDFSVPTGETTPLPYWSS